MQKSPERETRPWPMRPPLHSTAILDTKSRDKSLSNRLTLALISHPEELPSGPIDRACHTLGPKLKACLCFQTSVPTALANTPSRQGPLEPHRPIVPALLKETGPIPLVTTLQIRRNLQGPRGDPNSGVHLVQKCASDTT